MSLDNSLTNNRNNSTTDNSDNWAGRPTMTPEKLKEFIKFILENIVHNKEALDIGIIEDVPPACTVHIKVAEEDKGRVIGKKGATINALRSLVKVFGNILIVVND